MELEWSWSGVEWSGAGVESPESGISVFVPETAETWCEYLNWESPCQYLKWNTWSCNYTWNLSRYLNWEACTPVSPRVSPPVSPPCIECRAWFYRELPRPPLRRPVCNRQAVCVLCRVHSGLSGWVCECAVLGVLGVRVWDVCGSGGRMSRCFHPWRSGRVRHWSKSPCPVQRLSMCVTPSSSRTFTLSCPAPYREGWMP